MEMAKPNVVGDFDFTGTFLPWDPYGGFCTSISFAVRKEENGVKIVFTFENEATNTCTKLCVDPVHRTDVGDKNQITYNCEVCLFNSDKSIRYYHGIPLNAFYRKKILVDIDPYLITHDKAYFECLMRDVLKKDRIERYLAEGAKESPSQLCGNYVGGATYYKGNGFPQKGFNPEVGWHAHLMYGEELTRIKQESLIEHIKRLKEDNNRAIKEIEKLNATVERNNAFILNYMEQLKALGYNTEDIVPEQNDSSHVK